jgi:Spy/CpxP family protein refolding chaperone
MMQRGEGGMCVPDEADFECWRESLGLSEEQVSTLKGIYRAFRKEHIMDRARMESTEVDLRALLDTGSVDLGKVENTMKEIEGHRTSLRMGHVRAWEKAKGVFTDEQRKKIGALPCNPSMTVLESCPSAPAPHGHGEAPKDQEEGAGGKPPGHPM